MCEKNIVNDLLVINEREKRTSCYLNNPQNISSSKRKLTVFETFSGIGAQRKALELIKNKFNFNYEIVATSDWDIWANISYDVIHNKKQNKYIDKQKAIKYLSKFTHSLDGQTPLDIKKISKLSDEIISRLYWSYKNNNNLGSIKEVTAKKLLSSVKNKNIDLITYSFPCQDLSLAGNFHRPIKGMSKESNSRSGLVWEIGRLLNELHSLNKLPKFLLLENVKNINNSNNQKQYKLWEEELQNLGYQTKYFILNAKDYGLPQNRERFYAISILNCSNINEILTDDRVRKIVLDEKKLSDILKTNYFDEKYKYEALTCIPNRTKSRLSIFEKNKNLLDVEYCRTITKRQDRHPNAGIVNLKNTILDNEDRIKKNKANFRFITPREGMMLMGFEEEDYEKISNLEIKYPREKLYNQIGNTIAINVIIVLMKIIQEEKNKS